MTKWQTYLTGICTGELDDFLFTNHLGPVQKWSRAEMESCCSQRPNTNLDWWESLLWDVKGGYNRQLSQ